MKRQLYPPDNQVRIFIHSGVLSYSNGAVGPLSIFISLAEILEAEKEYGDGYANDSIVIKKEQLSIALELLKADKMVYKVEGTDNTWQGVLTDQVKEMINPSKRVTAVTAPVVKHSYVSKKEAKREFFANAFAMKGRSK